MNYKMIFYTVGQVLIVEAALLILPMAVSVVYLEWKSLYSLALTAFICVAAGGTLTLALKKKKPEIYAKEGLIIVSLAWIAVSLAGALPFVFGGAIPNYIDALFETVSGFTTTGASIIEDVEVMEHGLLFWRSFTHWIGGMGVLVFVMAIFSRTPDRSMNILRAEMPGPIVDKLVPRAKDTAKILYIMYVGLTVLLIVMLLCGGMPFYDSVIHAMGTAGTGGFSIKNASIGAYSKYCQWVIAVFMLLFGINFNWYYLLIIRKFRSAFSSGEFWSYIITVLLATAAVCYSVYPHYESFAEVVRDSFFQVSSFMTTTGYGTASFTEWPILAKTVLITLMFIGGCAGSTAGGFKISRVIILFKKIGNDLRKVLHPRTAAVVKFEGKRVSDTVLDGLGTYLAVYVASFFAIFLLLSIEKNFSIEANFTAAASCFNNIGPIFGNFANGETFANYSIFSKLLLTFAMLLGRLEIYPMLLTVNPYTWIKK